MRKSGSQILSLHRARLEKGRPGEETSSVVVCVGTRGSRLRLRPESSPSRQSIACVCFGPSSEVETQAELDLARIVRLGRNHPKRLRALQAACGVKEIHVVGDIKELCRER